jgi:hypothetical protein
MEEQEQENKPKPKVVIVGHIGHGRTSLQITEALIKAKEKGLNIEIVNTTESIPELIEPIIDISLPPFKDYKFPDKLHMLKGLNLSTEQIDYIKNSPPQRLEGESQDAYRERKMLNKLIVKYRGQF